MPDPVDIPAARALCNAATPGPWRAELNHDHPTKAPVLWDQREYFAGFYWRCHVPDKEAESIAQLEQDATFCAAARALLPLALDELEAARERIAVLEATNAAMEAALRKIRAHECQEIPCLVCAEAARIAIAHNVRDRIARAEQTKGGTT